MASKKRKPRPPATRPSAKAERRREELRRRADAERKEARSRRIRSILIRLGAGVVLAALVLTWLNLTRPKSSDAPPSLAPSTSPTVAPSALPGLQAGEAPWSAGNDPAALRARLEAIGLPALGTEGQVLHIHQHLDIFVNGNAVEVPAQIGISGDQRFLSDLHTHDTSGIIHVESATKRTYTLGEFFDVWGVAFSPSCIGGYCNSGNAVLTVYVNGHEVSGDPTRVVLRSNDEIALIYGTPAQLPNPIPSSFTFPSSL